MKKRFALALVLLVLAVVLAGAINWSLGTCRLLDRSLGLSGCRGSVVVADLSMLRSVTMSSPDADGISSLFGTALTADGTAPAMIRLDPKTGQEIGRHPLRVVFDIQRVTLADDRRRAAIDCVTSRHCAENGDSVTVISLRDGTEIETRDGWRSSPRRLLGDPEPDARFAFDAMFADKGNRIINRDGDALRIYAPDGTVVAQIGEWKRWTSPRLTISPSGRYLALVEEEARGQAGERFHVWDVRDGTRQTTIETAAGYRSRAHLVWSSDERSLFAFRQEEWVAYIDRFVLPGF